MYPLGLEHDYADVYKKEFSQFTSKVNWRVLEIVREYLKNEVRMDSEDSILEPRLDSSDLALEIEKLREEFGDFVPSSVFQNRISKNTKLIDAWAKSKTQEFANKQRAQMGNAPRSGVSGGNRSGFRVPAIQLPEDSEQIFERINRRIQEQKNIAHSGMLNHMTDVQRIVQDGLAKGKSFKDISKTLSQQKDITIKKADFWARDQVKNFHSEQTMLRQKEAGFTGFIWRNQNDSKVRDSHRGKSHGGPADQFWRWDNLPWVNRKGVGPAQLKPGDDWNCRCWAEPAWGPEGKDDELKNFDIQFSKSIQAPAKNFEIFVSQKESKGSIIKGLEYLDEIYVLPNDFPKALILTLPDTKEFKNVSGFYDKNKDIVLLSGKTEYSIYKESTTIHESHHRFDYKLMPGSEAYSSAYDKSFEKFRDAIHKSEVARTFKEILSSKRFKGRPLTTDLEDHLENYLLTYPELFARTNELFVANMLDSKKLKSQIEIKRKVDVVDPYLNESDYRKLEQILKDIYFRQGFLK